MREHVLRSDVGRFWCGQSGKRWTDDLSEAAVYEDCTLPVLPPGCRFIQIWTVLFMRPDDQRGDAFHESDWLLRLHAVGNDQIEVIIDCERAICAAIGSDDVDLSRYQPVGMYPGKLVDQYNPYLWKEG